MNKIGIMKFVGVYFGFKHVPLELSSVQIFPLYKKEKHLKLK